MKRVTFRVAGVAEAQGSVKAFARKGGGPPMLTSTNRNLKEWRTNVARTAMACARGVFFQKGEAVTLYVSFALPRPQSLPKRVRHHAKQPDLDKLTRAVNDALTNVLWHDDSQVVEIWARKIYTTEAAHAAISVTAAN